MEKIKAFFKNMSKKTRILLGSLLVLLLVGAAVLIVTELTTWALIVCIGDLLRAYDDTVTNGDGRPMRMPVRERLTQWFEHTLEMMGWLTWRR